jgi:hypothetical protein
MPAGRRPRARRQFGKPADGDHNRLQPEAANHQAEIDVYNHNHDRHRLPADNRDF